MPLGNIIPFSEKFNAVSSEKNEVNPSPGLLKSLITKRIRKGFAGQLNEELAIVSAGTILTNANLAFKSSICLFSHMHAAINPKKKPLDLTFRYFFNSLKRYFSALHLKRNH